MFKSVKFLMFPYSTSQLWTASPSQSPEVQVQVLGLQDVYGRPRGPYVDGADGGSEPRQGGVGCR